MSTCGDCKFWDRENQYKVKTIDILMPENAALCLDKHFKTGLLLGEKLVGNCVYFKRLKPKPTRAELHQKLDDILDARD